MNNIISNANTTSNTGTINISSELIGLTMILNVQFIHLKNFS